MQAVASLRTTASGEPVGLKRCIYGTGGHGKIVFHTLTSRGATVTHNFPDNSTFPPNL